MCKENLKTLYAVCFTYLDVAYNKRDLYFVAQVASLSNESLFY